MAEFAGFIGQSYTARSLAFDAQRAMNLYLESNESGTGDEPKALVGTPGCSLLMTLPTSPVRGIWTGLIDNLPGETGPDLCFAVAGSKLYQVLVGTCATSGTAVTRISGSTFPSNISAITIAGTAYTVSVWTSATAITLSSSAGTQANAAFTGYIQLGDVGNDAANSPVQFQVNGGQVLMSSAGIAWVNGFLPWDGGATETPQRAVYHNGLGTCSTSGTAVTWLSGASGSPLFDASQVGSGIVIAGVMYIIAAFTDETHITLASSAGTQASATFRVVTGTATVSTSGTAVTATETANIGTGLGGTPFTGLLAGDSFIVGSTVYTVASVQSGAALTLTASAGTQASVTAQWLQPVLAAQIEFLDTYFIALPPDSTSFQISNNNDGTDWQPLDNGVKSAYPDAIAAVLADHEELWLFGSETTEIWRNTGGDSTAGGFPLQRDPGAFVHQGCRAPFSAVSIANGVAFIGGDARGGPVAWFAQGYIPQRISTHAIEAAWAEYATVADAIAFVYVEDGHQFWVISFPTANATWCWDATEGVWHERGTLYSGTLGRLLYAHHGFVFGQHVGGDWNSGNLYTISPDVYTDNGTSIQRIRTAPYLSNDELWTFFSRFRLAMQSGPNPTLAWSDDLGATYSTAIAGSPLRLANSGLLQESQWMRLGRARKRVFSVQMTDATQITLTGAYVDAGGGNG